MRASLYVWAVLSVLLVARNTAGASTLVVPTDYPTITAAINAAAPGDVVSILPGDYFENINITKSIEIAGSGQGATVLYPAFSGPIGNGVGSISAGSSNVVLVRTNGVKIHDLTVDGDNPSLTSGVVTGGADLDARNGIITDHRYGKFNGLEVYNTTVRNIYLRGIYASSGGTFNFHDNTVSNVQGESNSIGVFNFGGSGLMVHNYVADCNDAIAANWSLGTQFVNNTVLRSGSGIHTDNAGQNHVADLIDGNHVADRPVDGWGIWVFVPYTAPIVQNNTIVNCNVGFAAFGSAPSCTTTILVKNNVIDCQSDPGSVGVFVTIDEIGWGYGNVRVSLVGNTVTNAELGFYFGETDYWGLETPYYGPPTTQRVTATLGGNSSANNGLDLFNESHALVSLPVLSQPSVDKPVIWPPNHKMIAETVSYVATVLGQPVNGVLTVTCNEPVAPADVKVIDPHHVQVRSERSGNSADRVYTILVDVADTVGNHSTKTVTVVVPHDQGK